MEYICDVCGTKFSKEYNLEAHKKRAKYCLVLQGKILDAKCEGCPKRFRTLGELKKHKETCVRFLTNKIALLEEEIDNLRENHTEEINNLREKYSEEIRALTDDYEEQLEALRGQNAELKLKTVETGTSRDIYKEEYQAIRDRPTTSSTSSTTYNSNSVNQKLNSINISTIEPFTLETVRRRVEAGGYSYELFLEGIEGVQKFILDLITKDDEKNYATTDISRSNFHRLEETRRWVGDKGALFIAKAFDEMKPSALEHFNNLQAQNKQASRVRDVAKLEELDAIREHTKDSLAGIIHPNSHQRKELLAEVIKYVKPYVAV